MFKKSLLVSGLFLVSSTVFAEGGYLGASVGKVDLDTEGFEDPTSFSITAGVRVNPNLGLEVSYIDFGEADDDVAPIWTLEADSIAFGLVGFLPVSDTVELHGKLGFHSWDATLSEAGFGTLAKDDGTDLYIGFGVTGKVSDRVDLFAEYQRFDFDTDDISSLSVGLRYSL